MAWKKVFVARHLLPSGIPSNTVEPLVTQWNPSLPGGTPSYPVEPLVTQQNP